ncbi:MAG TPA: hypothetical protein PL131_11165 [Methylotenera sp.]|nr:hypothetical protein [Methylotenera sp.]HPH06426.1 hypothetical protein [Methylotenera sp.]HPN00427.1 hypothetical protein [Methylotenera sp.]
MKLTHIFNNAQALHSLHESMLARVETIAMGACKDQKIPRCLWQSMVNEIIKRVTESWHQYQHQCRASIWIYSVAKNVCIETMRQP